MKEPDLINKPSEMGAKLGENMARFADQREIEWREQMGFIPVRCSTCAFTKGTPPNQMLGTMANATKCAMEGETFYCHHDTDKGRPHRVCAGWMLLNDDKHTKMPWDYIPAAKRPNKATP